MNGQVGPDLVFESDVGSEPVRLSRFFAVEPVNLAQQLCLFMHLIFLGERSEEYVSSVLRITTKFRLANKRVSNVQDAGEPAPSLLRPQSQVVIAEDFPPSQQPVAVVLLFARRNYL